MNSIFKACLVLAVIAIVVRSSSASTKCWSEDCDNKLRDCARNVVHCTDKCHHGCMREEGVCERAEVHRHGGKTPFAARRNCHDTNYNCIFECFNSCGKESKLKPCVESAERHCYDTCEHSHHTD